MYIRLHSWKRMIDANKREWRSNDVREKRESRGSRKSHLQKGYRETTSSPEHHTNHNTTPMDKHTAPANTAVSTTITLGIRARTLSALFTDPKLVLPILMRSLPECPLDVASS